MPLATHADTGSHQQMHRGREEGGDQAEGTENRQAGRRSRERNEKQSKHGMERNGIKTRTKRAVFKTWNGVYSKHGTGFIQNMEQGLFKTWNGVYSKHGTGCIQNMKRPVFKTWNGVYSKHGTERNIIRKHGTKRNVIKTWNGTNERIRTEFSLRHSL